MKSVINNTILYTLVFSLSVFANINPKPIKPYRGLAYSADDIVKVQQLAASGENKEFTDIVFNNAKKWIGYTDEQLLGLIPPSDAVYAFGTAGDPKTNKPWPRYGRSDDVCNLDRPGVVKSPYTGDIYGNQKPGEDYYDDGNGWVRPKDGKKFYFKGVWNSYISVQLHDAIDYLSVAYMLTGEEIYAEKALLILDKLSADRTFRPKDDGIIDYPYPMVADKGYFNFVGNGANERTVYTGLAFDLIANSPAATKSSSLNGMTVSENIKKNYFSVYEPWYLEDRGSLQNHALILLANMAMQGVLFGNGAYLETAIDGTYAFLDGTINRDGDYYELAGGYGQLGRDYGGVLIALLNNYNPKHYNSVAGLPKPEDYPYNLKIGNDIRWYTYCTDMPFKMSALGHYLQYGDSKCDRSILLNETYRWLAIRQSSSLLMINGMTDSPEKKEHIAKLYWSMKPENHIDPQIKDILLFGLSMWQSPQDVDIPNKGEGVNLVSELMPSKQIAILRSGEGEHKRALFIRGGNNASHGHDDQLATVPYGNGMILAGDYGYNFAGTPDHGGWGTRAAAHNMVTVNKDLPASYFYKGRSTRNSSGPSYVSGFLGSGKAQFIEMHNTGMWKTAAKDIEDYRRLAWLIDIDDENYYFADMFFVVGGSVHDYFWTAPYDDKPDSNTFKLEGITPQSKNGIWTLAALDDKYRDVSWNASGKSWGERLDGLGSGKIKDVGLNDLPEKQNYWNPAPGNGYGMFWDIKLEPAARDWQAQWRLVDRKNFLKTSILNYDGHTAITATAPSLKQDRHHNTIILRREGNGSGSLKSRFANISQVGQEDSFPVKNVSKSVFRANADDKGIIALEVELKNGNSDYLIGSRDSSRIRTRQVDMLGKRAFIRLDENDEVDHIAMQDCSFLKAGNVSIKAKQSQFRAQVLEVKSGWDKSVIVIDKRLPAGDTLKGQMLLVESNPAAKHQYSHNDYYYIETVEDCDNGGSRLIFRKQIPVATRLTVEEVDLEKNIITARWSNELAGGVNMPVFNGRLIAAEEDLGRSAFVTNYFQNTVEVDNASKFKQGDKLAVYVVKKGDVIMMPTTITLTRRSSKSYSLRANTEVEIEMPLAAGSISAEVIEEGKKVATSIRNNSSVKIVLDPAKLNTQELLLMIESDTE